MKDLFGEGKSKADLINDVVNQILRPVFAAEITSNSSTEIYLLNAILGKELKIQKFDDDGKVIGFIGSFYKNVRNTDLVDRDYKIDNSRIEILAKLTEKLESVLPD